MEVYTIFSPVSSGVLQFSRLAGNRHGKDGLNAHVHAHNAVSRQLPQLVPVPQNAYTEHAARDIRKILAAQQESQFCI